MQLFGNVWFISFMYWAFHYYRINERLVSGPDHLKVLFGSYTVIIEHYGISVVTVPLVLQEDRLGDFSKNPTYLFVNK